MNSIAIAVGIFVLTYVAIATEKVHKAIAAILGASLIIILKVLDQETAFRAVDLNVILLLASMMVIVNIIKKTGIFQWLAIKAAKATKGNPFRLMALLAGLAALLSAFLDNVTAILLIVPVTLLLAEELRLDPVPYLIAEIMSSNIGGTATLIGDPPNIMIGSAARIGFLSFLINLGGLCLLVQGAFLLGLWIFFRKKLHVPNVLKAKLREMDERRAITDSKLLKKCLIVLSLTLLGFVFQEALDLAPAAVALGGASFLMLIALEELNGKVTRRENDFAGKVAKGLGMPATGGSDAHDVVGVGKYATCFETPIANEKELVEALKSGAFTPVRFKEK